MFKPEYIYKDIVHLCLVYGGLTGILDKPYRMISSCSSHVDTLLPCICCFAFCTVNSPFSPTHTTAWVSDNTGKWANIYLERPGRKTMPAIKCPIDGCEYTNDDVEATIAAALLNCHASKHAPPVAPLATHQYRPSVRKPERPQIDIESSESQWAFFLDEWDTYKRRAGISGPDTTLELRATCSTTLPSLPIWIFGKRHARICRWGRPIKPHQEHSCEG